MATIGQVPDSDARASTGGLDVNRAALLHQREAALLPLGTIDSYTCAAPPGAGTGRVGGDTPGPVGSTVPPALRP